MLRAGSLLLCRTTFAWWVPRWGCWRPDSRRRHAWSRTGINSTARLCVCSRRKWVLLHLMRRWAIAARRHIRFDSPNIQQIVINY